jgi:putative transposase
MFLLRPGWVSNNNFLYCLGLAAKRCGVDVVATCAMSNHHHTVVYDADGVLPDFMQYFHLLMAKSINCLRGRWENMWASGGPSAVELVESEDVARAVVYTLSNPVKDFLVDTVAHWPGVNSWAAMRRGELMHATRPKMFFTENMPESVEFAVGVPEGAGGWKNGGDGGAAAFVGGVASGIAEVEAAARQQRMETGRRVVGRAVVLRQSPFSSPTSHAPRRQMSPRVKCGSKWHRIEALTRNRAFVQAHRKARICWLAGLPFEFPLGTWNLRHLVAPGAQAPPPDRAREFAELEF